jgi:hypothetical protein
MTEPEGLSPLAEDDPGQDDESSENTKRRSRLQGDSRHEDALKVLEAVGVLSDLIEAPSGIPDERDGPVPDLAEREIVAVVAIRIDTGDVRVSLVIQTRPVTDGRARHVISSGLRNLGDAERDRLTEEAAEQMIARWWDETTARWQTQDFGGLAMTAGT